MIFAAAALVFAAAPPAQAFQRVERQIEVGGNERSYIAYLPNSMGARRSAWPVMMVFHAGYASAEGMAEDAGFQNLSGAENFVIVYPQGFRRSWNDGVCCGPAARNNVDDVAFFHAVMEDLGSSIAVEPAAYVVGWSNGARMVYRLLCDAADRVAGAAAFGATFKLDRGTCPIFAPVPLMHLHGEKDAQSPIEGGPPRGGHEPSNSLIGSPPPPLESVQFVALHNRCRKAARNPMPGLGHDVTCLEFTHCAQAARVVYCPIPDQGHMWPGATGKRMFGPARTDVSGSRAILGFFAALRR